MARIVCCGEGMLELTRRGDDWRLGYGGDTLNTAVHLARLGHDVAYLTALGSDPFSDQLRAQWQAEGLDTSLVLTHPSRQPGLYAISIDARGERSFAYWRDTSAARELFALVDTDLLRRVVENCDLFYYSLISAAILPDSGRVSLLLLANMVRDAGGRVAFDGNYRASLWQSPLVARAVRDGALRVADIGLPTLDDETPLSGERDGDAVAAHWQAAGCRETVVKLGDSGCRLPDGTLVKPDEVVAPVDTSGAGDAFNAGYLSSRLNGEDVAAAARAGNRLAAWTIMRAGAIPPRDAA
jgi:2-dehydro-3-deoxygluconokinase